MRLGVPASVLLHAGALGLAFLSLPDSWRSKVVSEPVVPIEIISMAELAELTSVPAAALKPDPKPEPPTEQPPAPEGIEPAPQETVEPPPPPDPAPTITPEPKPVTKPEPLKQKPPVKPKPKDDALDFDRLSALVDKEREKQPESGAPSETTMESERPQEQVGPGDLLTASDISKMRAAVGRCWQTQALIGAPEPEKLLVQLEVELNADGTLKGQPRVMNAVQINLSGNQFWKVAEQVALRAVISCQPYDFLSADRYHVWKEMQLNFDPSEMAGF